MIAWRESTLTPEPRAGYSSGVIGGKLLLFGGTYWEGTKGNWTKKIFSAAVHAFDELRGLGAPCCARAFGRPGTIAPIISR